MTAFRHRSDIKARHFVKRVLTALPAVAIAAWVSVAAAATTTAIAHGDVWKYDDRGIDHGTAWLDIGFDDSAWGAGPGQLGYGDGDEATVLVKTEPIYPTYYFRKIFTLAEPVSQAYLTVLH